MNNKFLRLRQAESICFAPYLLSCTSFQSLCLFSPSWWSPCKSFFDGHFFFVYFTFGKEAKALWHISIIKVYYLTVLWSKFLFSVLVHQRDLLNHAVHPGDDLAETDVYPGLFCLFHLATEDLRKVALEAWARVWFSTQLPARVVIILSEPL